MSSKNKKFSVGDLVFVNGTGMSNVINPPPLIKAGIVMKKMRTRDLYAVYYRGKTYTNIHAQWIRRLA